jgi:hypothetical protein
MVSKDPSLIKHGASGKRKNATLTISQKIEIIRRAYVARVTV